jgi:hypothetical protein
MGNPKILPSHSYRVATVRFNIFQRQKIGGTPMAKKKKKSEEPEQAPPAPESKDGLWGSCVAITCFALAGFIVAVQMTGLWMVVCLGSTVVGTIVVAIGLNVLYVRARDHRSVLMAAEVQAEKVKQERLDKLKDELDEEAVRAVRANAKATAMEKARDAATKAEAAAVKKLNDNTADFNTQLQQAADEIQRLTEAKEAADIDRQAAEELADDLRRKLAKVEKKLKARAQQPPKKQRVADEQRDAEADAEAALEYDS